MILLHEKFFQSGGITKACNHEAIVGKSISVVNEMCFTSELNVTVSNELNFTNMSCFLDSQMQQPVGMAVITVAGEVCNCMDLDNYTYAIWIKLMKLMVYCVFKCN